MRNLQQQLPYKIRLESRRDFVIESAALLEKHARLKADAHAAGYILGQGATCGLVKIVDQTAHSQSTLRRLGHIDEQEQTDNNGASSAAPHRPAVPFGRPPGMPPMQPKHGSTRIKAMSIECLYGGIARRAPMGGNTSLLAQHRWPRTSIWPGIAPPPTLPPGEGIAPPPTLPPGDGIAPPPTLPPGTNPANSQDHTTSDSTVNHPVTIGFHSTWKTHDGQTAAILMPLAPKWGGSKREWEMKTMPPKQMQPWPERWDHYPPKWVPSTCPQTTGQWAWVPDNDSDDGETPHNTTTHTGDKDDQETTHKWGQGANQDKDPNYGKGTSERKGHYDKYGKWCGRNKGQKRRKPKPQYVYTIY